MLVYKDIFGNRAEITMTYSLPFKDSKRKVKTYVLKCFAEYDNDFLYHLSCFDDKDEAIKKLTTFSCGQWELVKCI